VSNGGVQKKIRIQYQDSVHIINSVAEPEPVERHHFAVGGAEFFRPGSGPEYVNSYKTFYKNPKFFILKFEVEFKNYNAMLFSLKNLLILIYVFIKHENFMKP
jgi:hypothetical protein